MCARAPTAPKLADRPMYARPAAEDDVGRRAMHAARRLPRRRAEYFARVSRRPFRRLDARASPALAARALLFLVARRRRGRLLGRRWRARAAPPRVSCHARPLPAHRAPSPPSRPTAIGPADIWEEFRDAVSGAWTGRAVSCAPDGTVPPDADDQPRRWSVRTVADPGTRGGIDAVDALDITTEYHPADTTSPSPRRAPTSFRPRRRADGQDDDRQGDYADGPVHVLPPCEPGAVAVFEFVSPRASPTEPKDAVLDAIRMPSRSRRRFRRGGSACGSPVGRRWREASQRRATAFRGGARDDLRERARWRKVVTIRILRNDASYASDDLGGRLGEDDIATGNWRAVGARVSHVRSLMDDVEYKSAWEETQRKEREEAERKEKEEKRARDPRWSGARQIPRRSRSRASLGLRESETGRPRTDRPQSCENKCGNDARGCRTGVFTDDPTSPTAPRGSHRRAHVGGEGQGAVQRRARELCGGNSPLALLPAARGRSWSR